LAPHVIPGPGVTFAQALLERLGLELLGNRVQHEGRVLNAELLGRAVDFAAQLLHRGLQLAGAQLLQIVE
jgi:hypothetical protein